MNRRPLGDQFGVLLGTILEGFGSLLGSFLEWFWYFLRVYFRQCNFIAIEDEFWWILKPFGEAKMSISLWRGCKNQSFALTNIQCWSEPILDEFWVALGVIFGSKIDQKSISKLSCIQERWLNRKMIVQRVAADLVATYFLGLGPLGRPTRAGKNHSTTGRNQKVALLLRI